MRYIYAKMGAILAAGLLIGLFLGFYIGVKQTISIGVDMILGIMNKYGYNFTAYSILLKEGIYKYQNQIGGYWTNASLPNN